MGDDIEPATDKPTVVVTGFGPFSVHTVNASWVAVNELATMGGLGDNVNLVAVQVPVSYQSVDELIPELWHKYQPKLMVHVGVSGTARELAFEQLAHNGPYNRPDITGRCPPSHCCKPGGADCIVSGLNMNAVCESLCCANCGVTASVSYDPGRYLCEYIYYQSLAINHRSTVFIHVPTLMFLSCQQLATGLKASIHFMLQQLNVSNYCLDAF